MNFMTDRKRAQGMGSGREGTHHHWQMMVSSIALVILTPFFVIIFGNAFGEDHAGVVEYLSRPFPAIVLAVCLVVGILHFMNEALEAIEDYVHGLAGRLALFGTKALAYLLIAVGLFAIAKIAL